MITIIVILEIILGKVYMKIPGVVVQLADEVVI